MGDIRHSSAGGSEGAGPLTPRQRIFVTEFLVDMNAARAAMAAGYSERGAPYAGRDMFARDAVYEAVESAIRRRESRTGVCRDRVLAEIARIAYGEVVVPEEGATDGLDGGCALGCTGWRMRLWFKVRALEMIGRYAGIFVPGASDELAEGRTGSDLDRLPTIIKFVTVHSREEAEAMRRTDEAARRADETR